MKWAHLLCIKMCGIGTSFAHENVWNWHIFCARKCVELAHLLCIKMCGIGTYFVHKNVWNWHIFFPTSHDDEMPLYRRKENYILVIVCWQWPRNYSDGFKWISRINSRLVSRKGPQRSKVTIVFVTTELISIYLFIIDHAGNYKNWCGTRQIVLNKLSILK